MRIAIICGALEPGHDGVGDYTRRLSGELIKQGHSITAIALNDRHIKSSIEILQDADGSVLNTLRIAASTTDAERYQALKIFIQNFNPDWVSLQFVPYSFHLKGTPFKLFSRLAGLNVKSRWHIMFHEIWLDKPERPMQHVVMLLQKLAIYAGVKNLRPQVINTTIAYNQQRLQRIGVSSQVLGLFGNIAKSDDIPVLSNINKESKNILYFGGPPRSEYLKLVLNGLASFCKDARQQVSVIVVSGTSTTKDAFVNALNGKLGTYGTKVLDMGFVETPMLSTLLSNCTVGVVRSEPYFIGKSGSAVGMLEHGLPVWLPKWTGREKVDYSFRQHLIHHDLSDACAQKHEDYSGLLTGTAKEFIAQLSVN
jgi:hypothetical protein